MVALSAVLFGVLALLIFYKCYKYTFYRPVNFPPGLPRIPIFGSYLFLLLINYKRLHEALIWLTKVYKSKIVGFYNGSSYLAIACNDYETAKSVLVSQDFDGRPDVFIARIKDPQRLNRGILFTEGEFWKSQRRFFLRHLRDFGFGRRFSELESGIRDEILQFFDTVKVGAKYDFEREFLKPNGEILFPNAFFGPMTNAFVKILSGSSLERADQEVFLRTGKHAMIIQKNSDASGRMMSIIPWIIDWFPGPTGYKELVISNEVVYQFMKSIVDKHLEHHEEYQDESFIGLYIQEIKNAKQIGIENSPYHYEQLIVSCVDFYFAALTTITTQFTILVREFLKHSKTVDRIRVEIDEVVGGGRLPELDDRINLPFTEAAIREVMRFETLIPNSVPHKALRDTKLGGFDIPEGTFVFANLYAAHRDDKVWTDPLVFRPDRFLDSDGRLNLQLDKSLPFGAGKRLCPGETFARNTLFLFVAAFYQNFNVEATDETAFKELETGIIRFPQPFWALVSKR